jgi:hypothetical protein
MGKISILASSLALLSSSALSQLQVITPESLANQFGNKQSSDSTNRGLIGATLGNFGHISYGQTVMGRLYYPTSNQDACEPFSAADFNKHWDDAEADGSLSSIVIVDRGNCHFVQKVENLQYVGARMAIIADNKDEFVTVVMANDGQGWTVNIPSFFVSKKDGDKLKKQLTDKPDEKVFISASLEINNPDNRVEYELWYSSFLDLEFY